MSTATTGDIVPADTALPLGLDDATLTEMKSFEDALAILGDAFGRDAITPIGDMLGTGFSVTEDKNSLCGDMMLIVKGEAHVSDKGTERDTFWSLHVMTVDGRKRIINDGSTGIAEQMDVLFAQTRAEDAERIAAGKKPRFTTKIVSVNGVDKELPVLVLPYKVDKGLRVSRYRNEHGECETFYLNTSSRA